MLSLNAQDTLKLKTIKTYYGEMNENVFYRMGELDNAVLNTDTLSRLFPELLVKNISNDTFSSSVVYEYIIDFFLYSADTSLLLSDRNVSMRFPFVGKDFFPGDTMSIYSMAFTILDVIDEIKVYYGIDFEQISFWKIITGISYTSKDGSYSDKVFHEGADTVIFRIVSGSVNIMEIENNPSIVSIYPNPAQTQFTVTNTENANLQLYNILGQEVLRTYGNEKNTIINVEFLPQGMYMLKVVKDKTSSVHKIQIVK